MLENDWLKLYDGCEIEAYQTISSIRLFTIYFRHQHLRFVVPTLHLQGGVKALNDVHGTV